jgi:hypothetical protein
MTNTEPMDMDLGAEPAAQASARAARGGRRTVRQAVHEPIHDPSRGAVVKGRNGETLSRTRKDATGDPLYVDPSIIPDGWDYQWNTTDVYGSTEHTRVQSNIMYANGWRPVMAERHPGMFMPHDYKGPIIVAGARLEERPKVLSDEARGEDISRARTQTRDRDEALMGRKADLRNSMRGGMEMGPKYRGTGGDLRMSIDRALDVPTPSYQPADDTVA